MATQDEGLRARAERLALAVKIKKIREARELQSDLGEPGRPGGLIHFVKYFWRILEPSTPFVDGWIMHAICMHLEAVTRGEIRRLLINVPPGFSKSLISNVFWPLWEWSAAGRPFIRYVTFAYAAHLTERDNRRFLDVAQSMPFQEVWGHAFHLSANGVVKPTNDAKGWKFSSSIDGVGTGERGGRVVCLPYDERILTDAGWLPIGEVVEKNLDVKVAGFDHALGAIEWQRIDAYERNPGNEIVEIRCEGGSVRCTGDHPIFVQGRGYARADSLREGDALVWCGGGIDLPALQCRNQAQTECAAKVLQSLVQDCIRKDAVPIYEHAPMRSVRKKSVPSTDPSQKVGCSLLQPRMPWKGKYQRGKPIISWRTCCQNVSNVRKRIQSKAWASGYRRVMLTGVCLAGQMAIRRICGKATIRQMLPKVWRVVSAPVAWGKVLQQIMRGVRSLAAHIWTRQWPLCARTSPAQVSNRMDALTQVSDKGAGWQSLPKVWARPGREAAPSCAPYRLRQNEFGSDEPYYALPLLPRQNARREKATSQVETRVVQSVESVGRCDVVYNVRVDRCHNYFANGILVHNCDDIHNVREGESEKIRSGTVQWVREGMSNRLNNMETDAIISIGQRVHEDDASNAMIESGDYVHFCVPMEYDPSRHCATPIGWEDPRTEYGELAWPERFPAHVVAQIKRTLGPYAYSAQYQQSPEPRGGGILKRDWWETYELPVGAAFRHSFEFIVASLDPAFTAREENDPSGFTVWGVYVESGQPKVVMLHAWKKWLELHGQTMERTPNESNKAYVRRASPHWGLVEWVAHDCARLKVNTLLIEDKASGHSVAQEIRRLYYGYGFGVRLVNPGKLDKRARAYAIQHLFADGIISAPASISGDLLVFRDWAQMVIDECAKFRGLPGDEDNLVDSVTQAIKYMRDEGRILRGDERRADETARATHKGGPRAAIYPA